MDTHFVVDFAYSFSLNLLRFYLVFAGCVLCTAILVWLVAPCFERRCEDIRDASVGAAAAAAVANVAGTALFIICFVIRCLN